MIATGAPGTTADERATARRTAMTFLARSLALATTLALLPGTALASPTTLATLQTVAVANDAGVAEALAQPAEPAQVSVTVSNVTGSAPACTTAPAVATAVPVAEAATVPGPTVAAPPSPPPPTYVPSPYADRIHKDRKSGKGLLIGGLSLGGFTYLYVSLAGALVIDKARNMQSDDPLTPGNEGRARDERRAFGRAMLIPVVGPALAIPKADTALQAWGAGLATITQLTAVTMTLVGMHRLARARRFERLEQQRLSMGAMASAQGGQVSLAVRF